MAKTSTDAPPATTGVAGHRAPPPQQAPPPGSRAANPAPRATYARVYFWLIALRFMAAALPGYIHPDEFFQGPEPMAAGVLQVRGPSVVARPSSRGSLVGHIRLVD